jgi:cell division protease FtsH
MKNMMNKRGGVMSFGNKTNEKTIVAVKDTGVTFEDVAGQDEAKESLDEIVDFLHNPEKYQAIGAKLPKGALLVGPPGTGKTLIAKAVAGEAKVPFFSMSGSEFVQMFVGMGAARVRELFKQAQEKSPCIIFIDEIDAIGKSREGQMSTNDEREQTLNQLLTEMDGFDSQRAVVILAATNRPEVLDPALLRPGRFDRRIIVDKPDLIGREAILKVHSKDVKMSENIDLHQIAKTTSGAAGADLANIINEAALLAVKEGRQLVEQKDLEEAIEAVIAGKVKKDRILSYHEKRSVAYHEIGHALVAIKLKNTDPVHKITIIPRTKGALGYTMQLPTEEKYLVTSEEMRDQIAVMLGGRAAEEVKFNQISTGAANDIERATEMARRMVTVYGMSERFDMVGLESPTSQYLNGRPMRNCSAKTEAEIDEEVLKIIKAQHQRAIDILKINFNALETSSAYLLEHETINGEEFTKIVEGKPLTEEE